MDNFKFKPIELDKLSSLERLTLIKSVYNLVDRNLDIKMDPNNYLLDKSLIYTTNNSVELEDIRLSFYPDFETRDYNTKLADFIRQCSSIMNADDCIWMGDLIRCAESGELGKLGETIDRKIEVLKEKSCRDLTPERLETLFYNSLILLFEQYSVNELTERLGLDKIEAGALECIYGGETDFFKAYEISKKVNGGEV